MIPKIKLGDVEISRLIIGGNPISGNSHVSSELNEEMEEYFTVENIKKTLFRCMECGINTMLLRSDRHIFRMMREFRRAGGDMHWIAQTAPEMISFEGNIWQIMRNRPAAIYLHGSDTDSLFMDGNYDEIKRRLGVIKRTGKSTGLCTHMPQVIEYAEEHNWDVDFYMASVYNLSRRRRISSAITGKANEGELFVDEDRALMYKAVRMTEKPCLVFKILGATRRCGSYEEVRSSFVEAFNNMKPVDAVVVGMFPKYKDQVYENACIVDEIAKGCGAGDGK